MGKAKTPTVSVWCVRGGRITEVTGCRLGKEMVTLPGGQRWARNGHGIEGYYESELAAAQAIKKSLPSLIKHYRERLDTYELVNADCDRILEGQRVDMHRIFSEVRGHAVADAVCGKVEPSAAAPGVGNG